MEDGDFPIWSRVGEDLVGGDGNYVDERDHVGTKGQFDEFFEVFF